MAVNGNKTTTWDEEIMDKALTDVLTGKMGYKMAARLYAIPRSTLQRRVAKYKESGNVIFPKSKGNFKRVFTEDQEAEIVERIKTMQNQMRRIKNISKKDMREIAFFYAVEHNVKHPFDLNAKMAGEDWLRGFLNRHPDVIEQKDVKSYSIPISGLPIARPIPIKPVSDYVKEMNNIRNNNLPRISTSGKGSQRKMMIGSDVEIKFVGKRSAPNEEPKAKKARRYDTTVYDEYNGEYPDIDYDQFFHFMCN